VAKEAKAAEEAFKNYLKVFEFQEDVQKEANEATNEYFKRQAELNAKAAEDQKEMWRQVFESIDQEQARMEEQGQILLGPFGNSEQLEELRKSLMTQEELEIEAHRKAMERLDTFSEEQLEALGGRQEVERQMEAEHQARLLDIRARGSGNILRMLEAFRRKDVRSALGHLQDMTAGLSSHSKKAFELNKLLSTANAVVKGIEAVQSAYAWGTSVGGPVLGAAAAAVAGAFTAAQVSAIQSTQFGSGSAPSIAGTTAATPVSPVEPVGRPQGTTTIVNLPGEDLISTRNVRELLKKIEESTRDGGRVVLAS